MINEQIQAFMAEFDAGMWEESRHLVDCLEMYTFGLTGSTDTRLLHDFPQFVVRPIWERLDVMMTRILRSHGREDLLAQWQSVHAALFPRSAEPEPLHPPEPDRLPRQRRCAKTKAAPRKRRARP
jgi:hypothetical protein